MKKTYKSICVLSPLVMRDVEDAPFLSFNLWIEPDGDGNEGGLKLIFQGGGIWEGGIAKKNKIQWSGTFIDENHEETFTMTPTCIGNIVGWDMNHDEEGSWDSADGADSMFLTKTEYNQFTLEVIITKGKKFNGKYDCLRCRVLLNNGELVYLKEVLKTAIPMLAFGKWPKDSD